MKIRHRIKFKYKLIVALAISACVLFAYGNACAYSSSSVYYKDLDGNGTEEKITLTGTVYDNAIGWKYGESTTKLSVEGSVRWETTFTQGEYRGDVYFHNLDNDNSNRLEIIVITDKWHFGDFGRDDYWTDRIRIYSTTGTLLTGPGDLGIDEYNDFVPLCRDLNGDGKLEVIIAGKIYVGQYTDINQGGALPHYTQIVYRDTLYVIDVNGYAVSHIPNNESYNNNYPRWKQIVSFESFSFEDRGGDGNEEVIITGRQYDLRPTEIQFTYGLEPINLERDIKLILHYESKSDTHVLERWPLELTIIEGNIRNQNGPAQGVRVYILKKIYIDKYYLAIANAVNIRTDANGNFKYFRFFDFSQSDSTSFYIWAQRNEEPVYYCADPDIGSPVNHGKAISKETMPIITEVSQDGTRVTGSMDINVAKINYKYNLSNRYKIDFSVLGALTVSGQIKYEDGTAITDEDVYVCSIDAPVEIDDNGNFATQVHPGADQWFIALPKGYTWTVPQGAGYSLSDTAITLPGWSESFYVFFMPALENNSPKYIFTASNPTISGYVKNDGPLGEVLAGVTVTIESDAIREGRLTTETSPVGRYQFTGLYCGFYKIAVSYSEYGFTTERNVKITGDITQNFYAYSISGNIVDPDGIGLEGTEVHMQRIQDGIVYTAETDSNGDYKRYIPTGNYRVLVE